MDFVCFVFVNPCMLSANRVDFGLLLFHKCSNFTPPPSGFSHVNGAAEPGCIAVVLVFGALAVMTEFETGSGGEGE